MPKNDDDDREFQLRPRKPPIRREARSSPAWSLAFRTVLKYSRTSRAGARRETIHSRPQYFQHCSVRVIYSSNRVAGHWRAHARYIARESASLQAHEPGFAADRNGVDVAAKLDQWQKSGDPRLWKLIISPEFGERLDLHGLTREVMGRMEADLHRSLEWVAVAHFNTEHPHVHVALRGVDGRGAELRLDRDYVRNGLRSLAQRFATVQIGYRTEQDAATALRRQVPVQRFSPLDRIILRRADGQDVPNYVRVTADPGGTGRGAFAAVREQSVVARLMTLETMGLARSEGSHRWRVRSDLETALRAMQRAADHQKTLSAHGALLSDQRLQLVAPSWREITEVQGRVLSHGEEDGGNLYLLIEGTNGRVYYLRYTAELDEARSRGDLTTNSFVEIRKTLDINQKRRIEVVNRGGADALLERPDHFHALAKRALLRGGIPVEQENWSGWLGKYQEKLCDAMDDVNNAKTRPRGHGR